MTKINKFVSLKVVKKATTPNQSRTNNNNRKVYDSARWRGENGIRMQKLRMNPFCEICYSKNNIVPASDIDHIKPISVGGEPFNFNNLQSLCNNCHNSKSGKEGFKGRGT